MAEANECWKCGTHYPASVVICVKCGINLKTGHPISSSSESPDSETGTGPHLRALQWVADTLPGLLKAHVLIGSILAALVAVFVLFISLSLILGAPLSAFPIGAAGLIILAQAITWMIQGEFQLMHSAMTEFRGKDWTTFVLCVFTPIILGFVFLKKADEREQAGPVSEVAPPDTLAKEAALDKNYLISSLSIADADNEFGGEGLCADAAGNIYAANPDACQVFKLDAVSGAVNVIAGNGEKGSSPNGTPARSAMLVAPRGVAAAKDGTLFIFDAHWIRKIDAAGKLSIVAGGPDQSDTDEGPATRCKLFPPLHIVADSAGNLYISERERHRVRMFDTKTGNLKMIAGTGKPGFSGDGGQATAAMLNAPWGITVDAGDNLYIADAQNGRIREVEKSSGTISTIAGSGKPATPGLNGLGGPALQAALPQPFQLAADSSGNLFFTVGQYPNRVAKIDAKSGTVHIVAGIPNPGFSGDGGPAHLAQLSSPGSLCSGPTGVIYIGDESNSRVRKLLKK